MTSFVYFACFLSELSSLNDQKQAFLHSCADVNKKSKCATGTYICMEKLILVTIMTICFKLIILLSFALTLNKKTFCRFHQTQTMVSNTHYSKDLVIYPTSVTVINCLDTSNETSQLIYMGLVKTCSGS